MNLLKSTADTAGQVIPKVPYIPVITRLLSVRKTDGQVPDRCFTHLSVCAPPFREDSAGASRDRNGTTPRLSTVLGKVLKLPPTAEATAQRKEKRR